MITYLEDVALKRESPESGTDILGRRCRVNVREEAVVGGGT